MIAPIRERERAERKRRGEPHPFAGGYLFNSGIDPTAIPLPSNNEEMPAAPVDEDVEMRGSSPDPLDNWGADAASLCDALITDAFVALSEDVGDGQSLLSLQDAVEFAFAARVRSGVPSEPNQWRDIAGCKDAEMWRAAALVEFNALLENGTFEPVSVERCSRLECKPTGLQHTETILGIQR